MKILLFLLIPYAEMLARRKASKTKLLKVKSMPAMSVYNHKWAWSATGSILGLSVLAPLVIIPLEYHFGNHNLSIRNIVSDFYQNAVRIDFVSGSLFLLFLTLGGLVGNMLFKIKRGHNAVASKDASFGHFLIKGECDTVEFKSSFRWDYRLQKTSKDIEFASLKTLAAFTNTNGGTLLIGVDDASAVVGLEKDYNTLKKPGRDGFEQYIMQAVSLSLGTENCKFLDISFVACDNKDVCMIQVKKATAPVFLKQQQNTHFFVRSGNGTRELNIQEALKYIKGL
jgi:hypothetical protein